jgi:hypothetical protein
MMVRRARSRVFGVALRKGADGHDSPTAGVRMKCEVKVSRVEYLDAGVVGIDSMATKHAVEHACAMRYRGRPNSHELSNECQ